MKGGCVSQWKVAAGLLFCVMVFASAKRPVFTNHFLVELHKGGEEEARQVAAEHGFGVRKIPFAEGFYHFYHNGLVKAKRRRSLHHKQQLERDPRGPWMPLRSSWTGILPFSSVDPWWATVHKDHYGTL
ncbi:proprotein convertase subtilisin/kexin type 2 [Phyllostomus discolor]|uniref:Proprotein convertase subtilisin/kexin type 2 n=1 Tax=Phyllostomus discolor TaxID=89673 RepID=A0A833Z7K7_9CHIR|nr:proprotein convertase subtilisin/kexin type 2 [Phyllostomus discolor]